MVKIDLLTTRLFEADLNFDGLRFEICHLRNIDTHLV